MSPSRCSFPSRPFHSFVPNRVGLVVLIAFGGVLALSVRTWAAPDDDKGAPKKKPVPKLVNPEATALTLRLLNRYVDNAMDKSEMDKRVAQAVDRIKNGRQIAQRIRDRFQALAEAQRERMLGQYLPLVRAGHIPDSRFQQLKGSLERRGSMLATTLPEQERWEPALPVRNGGATTKAPKRDDFDPAGRDEASPSRGVSKTSPSSSGQRRGAAAGGAGSRYRIEYKGLRCRAETDGLGSDEIYIITTSASAGSASLTTKQPTGGGYGEHDYYTDVDSGDRRRGPSQVVWSGAQETVTLTVAAWEQDVSDPDKVKEDVKVIFSIAEAIAKALNAPGWVNLALGIADDLVIALFGLLEDDLIQQRAVQISGAELARYADQADDHHQLQEWNGIRYHFYTRHRGDGADYYVFYRVYRD